MAELATSPEKHARDREKYNVNPANGDRIVYRHLLTRHVRLAGRTIPVAMSLPSWMLAGPAQPAVPAEARSRSGGGSTSSCAATSAWSRSSPTPATREYRRALASLSCPQCMHCINPRCQEPGCPLGSHIPVWVQLAYQGRWRQAAEELHAANNFPEFTSRICPAPCQAACKQALAASRCRWPTSSGRSSSGRSPAAGSTPAPPQRKTGRKVAVVGSGPAGLAAAQQLARAGHEVTVFEKDAACGGLLRYGIPASRLEKDLIDRRLEQLRAEGVVFRTGVEVGRDVGPAAPAGGVRRHLPGHRRQPRPRPGRAGPAAARRVLRDGLPPPGQRARGRAVRRRGRYHLSQGQGGRGDRRGADRRRLRGGGPGAGG